MMRFMKLNKPERMSISQLGDLISIEKVGIDASDMKISGAGIWHTQLHFTSDQAGGGGFDFLHQDNHVEFSGCLSVLQPSFTLW